MIRSPHDRESEAPRLELTPLIDVLFMLLVFLVLTANSALFALEVDLPDTDSEGLAAPSEEAIRIELFAGNPPYAVNGVRLGNWDSAAARLEELAAGPGEQQVVVAGAREATMDRLVEVLAGLQRLGLSAAEIVVQPE